MSYVRSCKHCGDLYISEEDEDDGFCEDCSDAHARLLADCQSHFNSLRPSSQANVRLRVRRLKQRIRPSPPSNLREAVVWLIRNPHVRITGPTPESADIVSRDEAFVRFEEGSLWFKGFNGYSHIPVVCIRTEATARAETSIVFDETGFTCERFGVPIRVEYLP
jgi:hypothetical protein